MLRNKTLTIEGTSKICVDIDTILLKFKSVPTGNVKEIRLQVCIKVIRFKISGKLPDVFETDDTKFGKDS